MRQIKYTWGGGISKTYLKLIFKPLIATSLALSLGVGILNAMTDPSIEYGISSANQPASLSNLSWSSGSTTSPQTSSTSIELLVFKFEKGTTPNSPQGSTNAYDSYKANQVYTITYQGGVEKQNYINNNLANPIAPSNEIGSSLKFDANGNALKLGASGTGTIVIDFGDYTTQKQRKMTMLFNGGASLTDMGVNDALQSSSSTYSLVGNIDIYSGDEATYDISFSNSMKGNITIYTNSFRNWSRYISGTRGTITFADNANLEGNITSKVNANSNNTKDANTIKGGATLIFGKTSTSTNTITGNIDFVNGNNQIIFNGTGVINGGICAKRSGYAEGDSKNRSVRILGTNTIQAINGTLKILGAISNDGGGINNIVAKNLTINAEILSNPSGTNTIQTTNGTLTLTGDISNNAGTNIIQAKNGMLTLGASDKKISIESNGGTTATNTLTANMIDAHISSLSVGGNANSNNDNTIVANNGNIYIGTLSSTSNRANASKAGNHITLLNGTLTIGSISASGNTKNSIILEGTQANLGSIANSSGGINNIAVSNGFIMGDISNDAGTNIIQAKNGMLTLGASEKKISIKSNGGTTATNTLTANMIDAHISSLSVGGNANSNNDNTIVANNGNIYIDTLSSTSNRANASKAGNHITLLNGTLTIGSISASGNTKNNITLGGTGTITGNINGNGANNFTLLSNSSTLILQGSSNTITSLTSRGGTLQLDSSSSSSSSSSGITLTAQTLDGVLAVSFKGSQTGNLTINGGTHTLSSISFESSSKGNLTLKNTNTTIASDISATTNNTLALTLTNSTLTLSGANTTLTSLSSDNSVIDLASTYPNTRVAARKTLSISDYKQGSNAEFILYANSKNADKVVFGNSQTTSGSGSSSTTTATISLIGSNDLFDVAYVAGSANNVMLVDATGTSIQVQGGSSIIGGILTQVDLVEDSGKYYVGKIEDKGLAQPYQEIMAMALNIDYKIFLANFNSLNKRMGELRDNPYNQGIWARVFGGAMSDDFGAGSKSEYVTAQGGYDYSFTLGNAKNYVGVAVAYGKSWSKSHDVSTGNIINGAGTFWLDKIDSNMVEVGIYNSYVMDSGWYNDSILKFDYIMSEFSLSNDPTMTKTNNFAMVLSDEFGYRYKFGGDKSWYIDPQLEVAFGYFNQSDFNRAIFDAHNVGTDVKATQDAILTLRSRIGASLGKKFKSEKGFASVYVGAFYEYDYIDGGEAQAGRVGGTITSLEKLQSNGRVIANIGSNIELTDGVRMYIDVEKSFGDKHRVDMQFNFGARYSFGERAKHSHTF